MKRNATEAGVSSSGGGTAVEPPSSSGGGGMHRMGAGTINPAESSSPATVTTNPADPPYIILPYHGEHKRAISSVRFAPSAPSDASEGGSGSGGNSGGGGAAPNSSTSGGGNNTESRITNNETLGPRKSTTACLLASASADGTAKIWELTHTMLDRVSKWYGAPNAPSNKNLIPIATLIGHARGINDVCWSRTAEYVATASDDKTLRLWDVQTSEALVEFKGHTNFVFSCNFNPQSNLLVSGSFDETVKLWDVRSGDCVSTLPAHSDPVTGVDFNRDGTYVVSGSHDGLIRVWDTATGECLKTIYAGGNPPVSHVLFSPNGRFVLSGTLDSKLRLWDVLAKGGGNGSESTKRKWTVLNKGEGEVGLDYRSSSSTAGGKGGMAGVRDYGDPGEAAAALQRQLLELGSGVGGGDGAATTISTSLDDPLSSSNRGGRCTKTYSGHVNTRYCIFSCFSVANKSRQSVVTGSEDGQIFLYDLQSRGIRQILTGGHSDAVLAVDAHDTREIICSGGMSNDRSIKFWMPVTPSVGKRKRRGDHGGGGGGGHAAASMGSHDVNE